LLKAGLDFLSPIDPIIERASNKRTIIDQINAINTNVLDLFSSSFAGLPPPYIMPQQLLFFYKPEMNKSSQKVVA
jgi:hypothetical protein